MCIISRSCGCRFDRGGDALVAATAAYVAAHRAVDLILRRIFGRREQRRGLHDLTGLAIPALRNVEGTPGFLHRMHPVRIESLDRCHGTPIEVIYRSDAGARSLAVDMHRASAAQRCTAAVFGSGQLKLISQVPQERHRRIAVERPLLAIDTEFDHRVPPRFEPSMCWTRYGRGHSARAAISVGA